MAETSYTKPFITTCNAELIDSINSNPAISPTLIQIINDSVNAPMDSTFWFTSPLTTAEMATLDVILGAWSCPMTLQDPTEVTPMNVSAGSPPGIGEVITWNGNEWIAGSTSLGTFQLVFTRDATSKNVWLSYYGDNSTHSYKIPAVIPWHCKLSGLTFSNERAGADTDVEIYKSNEGAGRTASKIFTWALRDTRIARKTNFSPDITFSPGDKVGIYLKDRGLDVYKVTIVMFFSITLMEESEHTENYSGNFSTTTSKKED